MWIISHVLVLWATSHVLATLIGLACICSIRCRRSIWGCRRSVRTTFENFHRGGHLIVPSWSVALTSMYGTNLPAVGRHHSPRSTVVTPEYEPWGPCTSAMVSVRHVLAIAPHLMRWSCQWCFGRQRPRGRCNHAKFHSNWSSAQRVQKGYVWLLMVTSHQ